MQARTSISFLLIVATLVPSLAGAQIRGEIVDPGLARMPVALPSLLAAGEPAPQWADRFTKVLAGDLTTSGLFRVIDAAAYVDGGRDSGLELATIDFADWDLVGAKGLVRGAYTTTPDGVEFEVRFFDVPGRRMMGGSKLKVAAGSLAEGVDRAAHRAADALIQDLTGRRGPFDSRIAFVSDRGGHTREIYAFSFEGTIQRVTEHRSLTMAPSWSPNAAALLFTSFRDGRPALFSKDLVSGFETRRASKMGLNIGGAWSPDGSLLAVARETDGNTDLYTLDFVSGAERRRTTHWGIDVDPAWSPDGRWLAFCSSRGGAPQVYVMRLSDGAVERRTFEGSYNCAPAWSPDGQWLAYAGRTGGRFQIFVMPSLGGVARQITFAGSNEDPTWSPDSRYVAYSSERAGRRKIYLSDRTGRWERQLTDGSGDDTSPSWSGRPSQ